ncbi:MAG: M2 family metallopeptidase [Gammaproteobacteria bacterium]|nr:M2 family metallopeptidase [Gammaproteobacteria bacterium]
MRFNKLLVALLTALFAAGITDTAVAAKKKKPTAADARKFVAEVEAKSKEIGTDNARLAWINSTYITEDSQILLAKAGERAQKLSLEWARKAKEFDGLKLDYDTKRKLRFLKQSFVLPPPEDAELNAELARLTTELPAEYSKFKYCRSEDECLTFDQMNIIMGQSRDPDELLEIWTEWRKVSPGYKDDYARIIELANTGSRDLGFKDAGAVWRLAYDMPPEDFAAELDNLIGQLSPLYEALHCHVRAKLNEEYGDDVVPETGPIPAHVLGNMWAQTWSNVYPLMGVEESEAAYDLTKIIEERGMSELDMTKTAEQFFVSLGFDPLPETFWRRSLFTDPGNRDVICYASAWQIDGDDDVRLKMCIQKNAEDFGTLHHELGHNYYQLAYKDQDYFYQGSANDGFHEAVGDTLALSVGPEYLKTLGFIDEVPDASSDIPLLMQSALDKVALLPWTYMVDQWRWRVFSGEIEPDEYNKAWWDLREKYMGLKPPVERSESDFDPGAKFHIPANVPYTRYFLAQVLQFQFHRALCDEAGYEGPLNRCSIYGSKEAGTKLKAMLEMGVSRPWQDALEVLTGSREMDATAILDYYASLKEWLDEQNQGRQCGW